MKGHKVNDKVTVVSLKAMPADIMTAMKGISMMDIDCLIMTYYKVLLKIGNEHKHEHEYVMVSF